MARKTKTTDAAGTLPESIRQREPVANGTGPQRKPLPQGTEFGADQLRALGLRLRQLREARTWSLKRLASESGVSVAAIQKIEMGMTNSGLLTVFALSEALGEPVDRLVRISQLESRVRKFVHVAVPRRPTRDLDLSGNLSDARMKGSVMVVPAGQRVTHSPDSASGPRFAYVLSGKVAVMFADGVTEQLATGDAMHLTVSEHITWLNQHKTDALILCVTDPRPHLEMDGTGEFE